MLQVTVKDATNALNKSDISNITVNLTFNSQTVSVLTNGSGVAVFRARADMMFMGGDSVTLTAQDSAQLYQKTSKIH